jgi:hypothetical protein
MPTHVPTAESQDGTWRWLLDLMLWKLMAS